ncbi:nuclear transcription factor Y subunit C-2-like [Andrographis paniculata]|uniref:nuclear transcription factor Y subunit C-2-like n=1 Tax=Andrographis paniculata TaxID=175694 RepID=UPI0021E8758D|nr:nuclear transcription factor Y subunit C-2-like [Andrographis paniculata]
MAPSSGQQQNFQSQLRQNIRAFWNDQLTEISGASDLQMSQSMLPISHVKKIMESNEEVKMLEKACELFIKELTVRAWIQANFNNSQTLHRNDVANAIRDIDVLKSPRNVVPMFSIAKEPAYAHQSNSGVGAAPYPMSIQFINQTIEAFVARKQAQPPPPLPSSSTGQADLGVDKCSD